jgi:hypothetical protein
LSRITDLEEENALLYERIAELESVTSSDLVDLISPAEAEIVELAENTIGRTLNLIEAFYLGRLLGAFKTPQVKRALISKKWDKDPLRSAYVATIRGAFGKATPQPESRHVEPKYKKVGLNYDPWAE